jgi:oligopeptide/dipeptide ABC transporter ATP-binding protein
MKVLLQVRNLRTQFRTESGIVNAVNGISYEVYEREILGLVGESGCGKSVSQLSTIQLIPNPPGKIVDGEVIFEGQDLLKYPANGKEMRSIRGGKISIIFQEPMTSLNPVLTVGNQLSEMLELHLKMKKKESRKRAAELLELVGIPDAKQRLESYPHQLSGGMRQRVMIAIALSCNPRLIIADEPTTALDVTTQAQLLELMKNMVDRFNTSLVIVTHNLGIVARYANRIFVMYAGSIVESGSAKEVFSNPRHPYTIGLLKSVPRLDEPRGRHLSSIEGMPPNLANMPDVCAFSFRCAYSHQCKSNTFPDMRLVGDNHYVRCHIDVEREK